MSASQRLRLNSPGQGTGSGDSGIVNERVLFLVFESIKWDLHALCLTSSVNRKLRAIAKRLLWRELCLYRAPRMVAALAVGEPNGSIPGGWHALAKLMFFCCGCESSRHFSVTRPSPGHFVRSSRFSKTSGRSFLTRRCRSDLLFMSDPCEHPMGDREDDLGIYRGIFQGFRRSRTRASLIGRRVEFDERVRCPYCGTRVWSMTTARLVPRSAARQLGSRDGGVEYFVCVYGHLHGTCLLVPLSSDEEGLNEEDDGNEGEDDESEDLETEYGLHGSSQDNQTVTSESTSSAGEDVVWTVGEDQDVVGS